MTANGANKCEDLVSVQAIHSELVLNPMNTRHDFRHDRFRMTSWTLSSLSVKANLANQTPQIADFSAKVSERTITTQPPSGP